MLNMNEHESLAEINENDKVLVKILRELRTFNAMKNYFCKVTTEVPIKRLAGSQ